MAVSQSDINFIRQNWPQASNIPVHEVRDLASQLDVTFSPDMATLLEQQQSLDVQTLDDQAAAGLDVDVDISDIPLDLGFENPQQEPIPQAAEEPPIPDIADELAQYEASMQSGAYDIEGAEADFDPYDFGFDEPPLAGPETEPAPTVPAQPQYAATSEPEALKERILRTPETNPGEDRAGLLASNPLNGYSAEEELNAIDANYNYGDYRNAAKAFTQHRRYTPADGMGRYYYSPNRFLKADEMKDRLDHFAGVDKSSRALPSEELDRTQVNAIRFLGRGFANTGDVGEKMDGTIYHKRMWHRAQEIFTNRIMDGVPPVLKPLEWDMASQNTPDQEQNATVDAEAKPGAPEAEQQAEQTTEQSNDVAGEKTQSAEGEAGPQGTDGEIGPTSDSEDPALKAVSELEQLADQYGNIDVSVAQYILETHGVDPDSALSKYLQDQASMDAATVYVQELLRYATTKAHLTGPSSQPKQTVEPSEDQKQQREAEQEKDPQGPKNDNKPNADKDNQQPQMVQKSAGVEAGKAFARGMAAGSGAAVGAISGIAGKAKGFLDQRRASQQKLNSDLKAGMKTMSLQVDAIAQDRQKMKSASNAFERKAIADGMSKKMMAFDRTCSKFTDTIQSPQGLKQASKPDMRSRLESLEGKVQSVFKDMEPGKGEKKAFESMSKTLESTLESIKALVEAIKSILPGMRQEGPSMAPANGPM